MQFLGAIRAIKQDLESSGIQSVFAVGPFNILSMEAKVVSPFNVREDVCAPLFTEQQVTELLAQFAAARDLELEDGIAADVYRLTGGHAGLVCACGRALDTPGKVAREAPRRISMAAWRDYSARQLRNDVMAWPTIARMVEHVATLPAGARSVLERAVFYNIDTLIIDGKLMTDAATQLATEGWMLPIGGRTADTFALSSPLLRRLALYALTSLRTVQINEPLPFVDGMLDFSAVVAIALPAFDGHVLREAARLSSKLSRATLPGVPSRKPVPREATYHSQLYAVTRHWFSATTHAHVYDQADVCHPADVDGEKTKHKEAADMLIMGSSRDGNVPALRHIVEIVASDSSSAIEDHCARTINYMATHKTDRGTCITFTAVQEVADVEAVVDAQLTWPTAEQLSSGMVAIHVVHDMQWSRAAVFARQHGRAPSQRTVVLDTLPLADAVAKAPGKDA